MRFVCVVDCAARSLCAMKSPDSVWVYVASTVENVAPPSTSTLTPVTPEFGGRFTMTATSIWPPTLFVCTGTWRPQPAAPGRAAFNGVQPTVIASICTVDAAAPAATVNEAQP